MSAEAQAQVQLLRGRDIRGAGEHLEKTKLHRKGAGLGGRLPAPNVRTDYAGQKAGGYPRDVLLFRRLVYLHHRFINLQYRETGRAKAANRTHQTTAVARQ